MTNHRGYGFITENIKGKLSEESIRLIHHVSNEIVHQIRNPLGSIELLASLLLREQKKDINRRRVEQILSAVKSINQSLMGLVRTSKLLQIPFEPLNLNDLLKEITGDNLLFTDQGKPYLVLNYTSNVPPILGNREMLRFLLITIIYTAIRYLTEEEHLFVSTEVKKAQTNYSSKTVSHVVLNLVERGNSALQERVSPFEYFIYEHGKNSGLAFTILYTIVDIHNGIINFEADNDNSIRFSISFPATGGSEQE
ncbi:MAG: hypothetical protein N2317_03790 [Syntrophales bacterium]|nr:hypothetical protein [Syntrophales bacterium]